MFLLSSLFKLLTNYIFVIILVFFLTIPFLSQKKKAYFFNLHPQNIFVDMEKDIDLYLNSKIKSSKIKKYGTIIIPILFDRMKKDVAHKNEYLNLYNSLDFNLFDIPENEIFNFTFYLNQYSKIAHNYSKMDIDSKLEKYLLDKDIKSDIDKLGTVVIPNLLDFINRHQNSLSFEELKPLYLILTKRLNKKMLNERDLNAWFNSFFLEKRDYYIKISFLKRAKMLISGTMFYEWIVKSFSFDFGVYQNQSIYYLVKERGIRTFFIFIFSLSFGYYFIILLLRYKKLEKVSKFVNKNVKLINIFPTIILIILLSLISKSFFKESSISLFSFYLFSVFLMTISFLIIEIELIYNNILKNRKILSLKLYGIDDKTILKNYILKKINIESIDKIVTMAPSLLFYLIITEYIFNFNGIGYLFFTSLKDKNYELIRSSFLTLGIILILTNLFLNLIIKLKYNFMNFKR